MAEIVLIGPTGAGKSTVAELLAERAGLQRVPMDFVRWQYYFRAGYSLEEEARRVAAGGLAARFAYWKPFEAAAVEAVVADFPGALIDFGAGHSFQEDPALFARTAAALARVPHVVLLLPSPDPERSQAHLLARLGRRADREPEVADRLRRMLGHPSNARLATATVYTEARTPEETTAEVAALVGRA
jgi:adenylate kinase family enzyme